MTLSSPSGSDLALLEVSAAAEGGSDKGGSLPEATSPVTRRGAS